MLTRTVTRSVAHHASKSDKAFASTISSPIPFDAAQPTKKSSTPSRSRSLLQKKNPPSLEHFIQRQRAIHLYRDILRRLYSIRPSARQQRDEFIAHAKGEFERHRHVDDVGKMRYLISTGKAEMKTWERMVQELAGE